MATCYSQMQTLITYVYSQRLDPELPMEMNLSSEEVSKMGMPSHVWHTVKMSSIVHPKCTCVFIVFEVALPLTGFLAVWKSAYPRLMWKQVQGILPPDEAWNTRSLQTNPCLFHRQPLWCHSSRKLCFSMSSLILGKMTFIINHFKAESQRSRELSFPLPQLTKSWTDGAARWRVWFRKDLQTKASMSRALFQVCLTFLDAIAVAILPPCWVCQVE